MNTKLSENDIDDVVIAQAKNDELWEDSTLIKRKNTLSLPLPIKVNKDI